MEAKQSVEIPTPAPLPYRFNLALSPEEKKDLEALKTKTHKSSFVDVIRSAVAIFDLVVKHQQAGGKIILVNPDGKEEVTRFIW